MGRLCQDHAAEYCKNATSTMTSRASATPPRGILHSEPVAGRHVRLLPAADLGGFVEHFWWVSWELADSPARIVETLPHPSVHMVFERDKTAELVGIHRGRFSRTLAGDGEVFGVKFRPGGFYPFWLRPIVQLVDKRLSLAEAFGLDGKHLADAVANAVSDELCMGQVETFLRNRLPDPDSNVALVDRIVERVRADRSVIKVEQLTDEFALSARMLQRLFQRYVGISPKWMIQRYRLHEALAQLATVVDPDWPSFALALGYSDQAHFIRDFQTLIGKTPVNYWKSHRR